LPGQRVYAIGDIHGCLDQLQAMHALIEADLADRPVAHALVMHLGDYIDRGPDNAGVLAYLADLHQLGSAPVRNLRGNHEDMLLTALATNDRRAGESWLANGGGETLAGWGISWRDSPSAWMESIPPVQLGFLRGLGVAHRIGGYVFVHAGLRPGIAFEQQSEQDMLWIREPFLSWTGALPGVVVHGHTPEHDPVVTANRIGIDTGAVMGGALTCAVLQDDTIAFLTA
jgi:serine/threonine protein phosphatase 1